MRTVHETEALRPSDPIPKHHNPPQSGTPGPTTSSSKTPRIKLKLSHPSKDGAHNGADKDADLEDSEALPVPEFGEMGFDEHELSLPPQQLYRVLRRQIHWAEKETAELKRKWEEIIQPLRKQTWREKEAILEDVINTEIKVLGSDVGAGPSAGAKGVPSGEDLDTVGADEGNDDPLSRIKEQSAGPADDESALADNDNDVSMMDADVPTPDIPIDTKPPVGLEAVEPQPG